MQRKSTSCQMKKKGVYGWTCKKNEVEAASSLSDLMDSGQNQISVPRVPLGGIDLGFLVFPRAIVTLYQYIARKARITFIQKETISLSQSKTISTS